MNIDVSCVWEAHPKGGCMYIYEARPFKHTESSLFAHTFKYTDGTGVSYYLRGVAVSPALNIFECRYRTYDYLYIYGDIDSIIIVYEYEYV